MTDLVELTEFLEKSIYTPLLENDPSYTNLKQNLSNIVSLAVKRTGYDISELPPEKEYYAILLSQSLVYRTLATSKAPDINVESEFTKILRGDRFTHYMKLVESIQKEIDSIVKTDAILDIKQGELTITDRNFSLRNYALAKNQDIVLSASNITSNSVDVDWSIFDGSSFYYYTLYLGNSLLYDPYEVPPIDVTKAMSTVAISDIKRTKFRFKGLTPLTNYSLVICYKDLTETTTYANTSFTTLSEGE